MTEPTDERLLELAGKATPGERFEGQWGGKYEVWVEWPGGVTDGDRCGRVLMTLNGNYPVDDDHAFALACSPDRIRALVEGKRRAEEALRVELNELLKRNEGRTHYPGCEKEHPMCAAIGRIRAVLPHPTPEEPAK
jgi:hypothetical protein